ncbi:MAG: hydroxymethylglutaryl-CoA lyase [Planctomycetota bacterium]|nr:MAG: hydroxymethylglutaryl-CoA lyase [Planctomycetota bacterium]
MTAPQVARKLPRKVNFCECWTRDGLQSITTLVSTEHKLEMLNGIIGAGVRELEVTSFSHPKLLPQFADAEQVLKGIRRDTGARFRILMPNMKGWERLERCIDEGYSAHKIILMISASEAHNLKNFRMSHDEAMAEHAAIMQRAHAKGVEIVGCVGTVYGCAIIGDVPMEPIEKLTRFYHDHGAQLLMLGDTTGTANPAQAERVLGHLMGKFPKTTFLAHFHDTRGTGVVNSYVAACLGIEWIDGSIGAIGGQPATGAALYHVGFKGNTCSEDLLAMLEECGVDTGVDIEAYIKLGRRAEEIVGFPMRSNVIRAGRVSHTPTTAEKAPGERMGAATGTL